MVNISAVSHVQHTHSSSLISVREFGGRKVEGEHCLAADWHVARPEALRTEPLCPKGAGLPGEAGEPTGAALLERRHSGCLVWKGALALLQWPRF